MKVYLVGGAVRDELLGLAVVERDWVVVGATATKLLDLGYVTVGKDFPVFLHPITKEEYALARTEKKNGHGYTGFTFQTSSKITLEEDLLRRDLTINAIAKDKSGMLIDPFGGQADLQNKVLRNVSPAFVEDPLRLLRLARFAAKFSEFTVCQQTEVLCQQLVDSGEINFLTAERVWLELVKSLSLTAAWRFFQTLESFGANEILWPHFLPEKYVNILRATVKFKGNVKIRFATLCYGIEESLLKSFIRKYKVPKEYSELATLVVKYARYYNKDLFLAPNVVSLLSKLDVWRRPARLKDFCDACSVHCENYEGIKSLLLSCYEVAARVSKNSLSNREKLQGPEIGQAIMRERELEITKYLASI